MPSKNKATSPVSVSEMNEGSFSSAPKKQKLDQQPQSPLTKPRRPLSAYNFFFKDKRNEILETAAVRPQGKPRHSHGKIGFADLARTIAGQWKAAPEAERAPYVEKARIAKSEYDQLMALYKAKTEFGLEERLFQTEESTGAVPAATVTPKGKATPVSTPPSSPSSTKKVVVTRAKQEQQQQQQPYGSTPRTEDGGVFSPSAAAPAASPTTHGGQACVSPDRREPRRLSSFSAATAPKQPEHTDNNNSNNSDQHPFASLILTPDSQKGRNVECFDASHLWGSGASIAAGSLGDASDGSVSLAARQQDNNNSNPHDTITFSNTEDAERYYEQRVREFCWHERRRIALLVRKRRLERLREFEHHARHQEMAHVQHQQQQSLLHPGRNINDNEGNEDGANDNHFVVEHEQQHQNQHQPSGSTGVATNSASHGHHHSPYHASAGDEWLRH